MDNRPEVEPGKVFVGGLSWDTTKEGLMKHFSQYGEVTDAVIMINPIENKPRGFGFVTFKDPSIVDQVCAQKHVLDSKQVDPKPATSRTSNQTNYTGRVRKIFIGGVSQSTTEDDIRSYFSQFGNVTDVDLKYDKATQRMKGFGFVGFDSEDVVEKLAQARFHTINGKSVEAKKAEPRQSGTSNPQMNQQAAFSSNPMENAQFRQQSSFGAYPGGQQQQYYNSGYQQQQFGNYAGMNYSSSPYQQSFNPQPQAGAGYDQSQNYAYSNYSTVRQGQDQVATYGQEQVTPSYAGAPRTSYTNTDYSQTTPGYGYANPTAAPYSTYQDQTAMMASYGRGQAPQRTTYAPPPFRTQ